MIFMHYGVEQNLFELKVHAPKSLKKLFSLNLQIIIHGEKMQTCISFASTVIRENKVYVF